MSIKFTEEETLEEIKKHKDNIVRKVRYKSEVEQAKKDTAKAYRDQLKEIKEDIETELASILELENHLKLLTAQAV